MKYSLVGFILLFTFNSKAQINLELNDVLFLEFSYTLPTGVPANSTFLDTTLTVPTGKVFKVENIGLNSEFGYGRLYLNDVLIENTQTYDDVIRLPLWLPQGSYNIKLKINTTSIPTTPKSIYCFFSILEFNKN